MNARAIALGDQAVFLADTPADYIRAVVGRVHGDPLNTLDRAAEAIGAHPSGTLLIKAGVDLLKLWRPAVPTLAECGWTCTDIEPWTTWKHPDKPTVHVGALGAIDYSRVPLFGPADRPADVVRRIAWADLAIGAPFHMTAGVTGHVAIRRHFEQARKAGKRSGNGNFSEPYWGAGTRREQDDRRNGSGDLIWKRRPTQRDVEQGWVHSYDLNAARLSAMGVAELAYGRLKPYDQPTFDTGQAGYWLVHARDIREPFPGAIYDQADVHEGCVWLTTPMMQFLLGLGACPHPIKSYTATGRRILRPIAEKWDAARKQAPPGPALDTVKAVYREACGLFASNGGSIVRHDWYHTIMDRQRATMLSHILRIKRAGFGLPLVVHTDCLWYPSNDEDPSRTALHLGLRLGSALGTFRNHTTRTAGEAYKKRG